MNKTETKSVLDALKRTINGYEAWGCGTQFIEDAIAICEASIARVVEPVGRVAGDDVRRMIVWSPAIAAFDYPVGTLVYATPQEAVAPDLLEALKYARRMVNASECDIAFIDSAIAKATA